MISEQPVPPVGCDLTSPLAQLLFAIAHAGLLGLKPGPLSAPVPQSFRCRGCHSKETRMKMVGAIPIGLAPITGFELRSRCCGALNRFEIPAAERQAA